VVPDWVPECGGTVTEQVRLVNIVRSSLERKFLDVQALAVTRTVIGAGGTSATLAFETREAFAITSLTVADTSTSTLSISVVLSNLRWSVRPCKFERASALRAITTVMGQAEAPVIVALALGIIIASTNATITGASACPMTVVIALSALALSNLHGRTLHLRLDSTTDMLSVLVLVSATVRLVIANASLVSKARVALVPPAPMTVLVTANACTSRNFRSKLLLTMLTSLTCSVTVPPHSGTQSGTTPSLAPAFAIPSTVMSIAPRDFVITALISWTFATICWLLPSTRPRTLSYTLLPTHYFIPSHSL